MTNTWFTPKVFIDVLGPFDLDPCTQSKRPFNTAKLHYCGDLNEDGLTLPWNGRVWLNPPYGKSTGTWLETLANHGNGIALVFARTETQWAQITLDKCDGVNFLSGRINFIREDGGKSTNAGTGSMLIAFGKENVNAIKQMDGLFCIPVKTLD
jgi:hypothetical protein